MRKFFARLGLFWCIGVWFFMPHPSVAQFTQVQGVVVDPNGIPYSNGTILPTLIISGSPRFASSGFPYVPPSQPSGLDSAGRFVVNLADVNQILPSGGLWSFHTCSAPVPNAGSICFDISGIAITGPVFDISQPLQAAALPLSGGGGGGGGGAGNPLPRPGSLLMPTGVISEGYLSWQTPSIPAQTCTTNTFTMSGARQDKDFIIPLWPAALPANLVGIIRVVQSDIIEVRLCNPTSSTIGAVGTPLNFGAKVLR
jgi:hypothetical protein